MIFFSLLVSAFVANAQPQTVARPKLVVGIVVDQMRYDYLYRFYPRYVQGGFKRLLREGYSCEQTMINYLPSFTAPGHTCIYTGSVPAIHGIAGNDWYDNNTGKTVYCTEDKSVEAVGGSDKAGKMSPKNMLTTTITDELRLATNKQSKVFGISLKDRGSILPAGHLANGAFWYDESNGSFISSSYYGNSLPQWLVQFNNKHVADSFLNKPWNTLYPISTYTQSLADDNKYEGKFKGEATPTFPHLVHGKKGYDLIRRIPYGNTMTLLAAKACMEGESLGKGKQTDFLCISLSSTDYVGHQFAPNSIEIEDTYLRLDKDIAEYLKYLDAKIGKGNYLVFLTADHGGAHNAQYLEDINIPSGNASEKKLKKQLREYVKTLTAIDSLILDITNYQVVLDEERLIKKGVNRKELKRNIVAWLHTQPDIAYVMDMEQTHKAAIPEPIKTMAINGYNRLRSGDILIIYNPGWYQGYSPTGTTHGTWNPYDTHIPLLWYGWQIPKGQTNKRVHMEDIAATLAAMLHIQMPNGCIGKPIEGVMK